MKTTPLILMALLCLNFCYAQDKKNCPKPTKPSQVITAKPGIKPNNSSVNQPYKYDFSGFKSGYQPGYIVTDDAFMKGKTIVVRNYSIIQLFTLALRLQKGNIDTSKEQAIGKDQIVIEVRQPEKLNTLYCYKLVVPFYLTDNFYIIMHQSINEEFPQYTAKMERRDGADVMVIKDKEL
ncbi:hypothetical protein [Pedobacter ginsengisoli]|uniref:hypothetical protein n=1 Tax=Pedobacter ginsengisoli TaxID=363852 RepID=UPI00254A678D|nr:hypothetical protein [Pedobacter ginsengisoli]